MIRRALVVLALASTVLPFLPFSAASAATSGPVGAATARQDTGTAELTVTGWAYDTRHSAASIDVSVFVDGRWAGHVLANRSSPGLDRARHISGRHVFRFARSWHRRVGTVTITSASHQTLHRSTATHVRTAPGTRIISVAKRYVGRVRYVEGGASPRTGFDCSGYTMYAYAQSKVRSLPHNAEAQRHVHGMRKISRAAARAGDLVFYLAGGSAYHVAIYAGHGMQYSAATPRDGIRYQKVWDSRAEFRTILR